MKNLYNITKAQLITTWVFGMFIFFIASAAGSEENIGAMLICVILFFSVIFYTFGWFSNRKGKR